MVIENKRGYLAAPPQCAKETLVIGRIAACAVELDPRVPCKLHAGGASARTGDIYGLAREWHLRYLWHSTFGFNKASFGIVTFGPSRTTKSVDVDGISSREVSLAWAMHQITGHVSAGKIQCTK